MIRRNRKPSVVVSVRMDPAALDDIQRLAAADGIASVSEWIRRAAAAAVFEREKHAPAPGYRVTGWQCAHMNMTSGGMECGSVTAECGCEMQPVYDVVRAA